MYFLLYVLWQRVLLFRNVLCIKALPLLLYSNLGGIFFLIPRLSLENSYSLFCIFIHVHVVICNFHKIPSNNNLFQLSTSVSLLLGQKEVNYIQDIAIERVRTA